MRTKQFLYCCYTCLCTRRWRSLLLLLRCLLATSCPGSATLLLHGCPCRRRQPGNQSAASRCCWGAPPEIHLPQARESISNRETRDEPGMARSGTRGGAGLQIERGGVGRRWGKESGRGGCGADRGSERRGGGDAPWRRGDRTRSARGEPVPRRPLVLEVSLGSASRANIRPMGTRWWYSICQLNTRTRPGNGSDPWHSSPFQQLNTP